LDPESHNLAEKRIGYICDHQFPLNRSDAGAEQVINTVSSLSQEGLDIELIIPKRWKNIGRSNAMRRNEIGAYYGLTAGFALTELVHLPLMPLRLEKYSHALLATPYCKLRRHDIVYTRNRVPALLALKLNLPVLFETYRLFDGAALRFAERIAGYTRRTNFVGVITHSIPAKENLLNLGVAERKITVIYNGFNPNLMHPTLSRQSARAKLSWPPEAKIACYTGRLDRLKGIESILALAKVTPEIDYMLVGQVEKDTDDWIERAAKMQRIANVKRLPWVSTREVPTYLFASDVLVIPPTREPLLKYGRTVLPIKTFMYMATGVAILAPRLPDTAGVLTERNAVLVEPDDIEKAKQAMRKIFSNRDWSDAIGRQARIDAGQFTWQTRAKKIVAFLEHQLGEQAQ
jgi:glycosyltransferase involved in cell wall biosynthesis